jgi:hypothetical protein
MLHHVDLVRTDVSKELRASFIRVTRSDELGTMLAVTSKILRFLQEPHSVTSQKTPLFIVTAVKTSNLTTVWFNQVKKNRKSCQKIKQRNQMPPLDSIECKLFLEKENIKC